MNDLERFREKLRQSLEGHLDSPKVDVIEGDPFRFLGIIVSPSFEGMEDTDRQRIVWDRVLKTFDERDRKRIEFLFTNAPSEVAAEEVGAAPQMGPKEQTLGKG
jgi:acid stress-induced BolA-like protein IbaG/YrbA